MTQEQQAILIIKGQISELPPAEGEACKELVNHLRQAIQTAGRPVVDLAIALIAAEANSQPYIAWGTFEQRIEQYTRR